MKKIVWPVLDRSFIQSGAIRFMDYEFRKHLPFPRKEHLPYGIEIKSEKAEKTAVWLEKGPPWKGGIYHTVLYENGIYRVWYDAWYKGKGGLCYMESTDGLHWKKPTIRTKDGEDSNIVFSDDIEEGDLHGSGVFLDPSVPASERYKLIYMKAMGKHSQIRGAVSEDGLIWERIEEVLLDNYYSDTQNTAYYDRQIKSYVGYFRKWVDGGVGIFFGGRRVIARAETKDFKHWPAPKTVLSLGINYHLSHDLYTNAHVLYPTRDDLHLFFPAQYNREKDSPEIYLATSKDGISWEYFGKNPVVTLGEKGSGLEGAVYAGCGLVSLSGDRFGLPCCGYIRTHNAGESEKNYFWATWKTDRLASIEATEEGFFSMPLFNKEVQFDELRLNFLTQPAGMIKVQIVDNKGETISGYAFSDCALLFGNELNHPVKWRKAGISQVKKRPFALQFRMSRAKLFALSFLGEKIPELISGGELHST